MISTAGRLARSVRPKDPTADTSVKRRLGKVINIDAGLVDIVLGGASDEEAIVGVSYLNSYSPVVDDIVWVDLKGGNPLVIGSTNSVSFVPDVPSDWDSSPETVAEALNELAARLRALE